MVFCDDSRIHWSQVLNNEAPNAAMEEDRSQTCGQNAESFQVFDEAVRRHPNIEGVPVEQVGILHTAGG